MSCKHEWSPVVAKTLQCDLCWTGWQARAALERKP